MGRSRDTLLRKIFKPGLLPKAGQLLGAVLLAALLPLAELHAASVDTTPQEPSARPRIVLVLSGGGARGGAHIGVLRALEEMRVPVDAIVGTSMGAVIGGLYAAGLDPDQLERMAVSLDWVDLFDDAPDRAAFRVRYKQQDDKLLARAASGVGAGGIRLPQGYLRGHKLKALLTRQTLQVADIDDFSQLPIPFTAVAADITTGDAVELRQGDLPEALFASMAIPALVTPQKVGNHLLVDGGVANNLPVDVALAGGADIIIAVDISSPLYTEAELTSVLTVTDQLTNLLTRKNTEARITQLRSQDLLIEPVLGVVSSVDFAAMATVITTGYRATQAARDRLAPLAVSKAEFHRQLARQRRGTLETIRVERIDVAADGVIDDAQLAARIGLRPGEISVAAVEQAADRLYGLELFSEVPWEYHDGALVLKPTRKSWGPNYLRAGFGLEDDFEGRNHYRLGLALTATELNPAGAEWRTEAYIGDRPGLTTEWHQPFGRTGAWYVRPGFGWRGFTRPVYDGDYRVADYQIRQTALELAAGRTFGTSFDARLELFSGRGSRERLVGDPAISGGDADSGWIAFNLEQDSLDNVFFPRHGRRMGLRWRHADSALGAEVEYNAWRAELTQALAIGPHSVVLSAEYDSVYSGTAPFHEAYTLGGFFRLSGVPVDARLGQQRALHRAAYYYRMQDDAIVPVYLGASFEAGQVWAAEDNIDAGELDLAGSLFIGVDSPIGPIYLGGGLAEDGNRSLYIFLGQPF